MNFKFNIYYCCSLILLLVFTMGVGEKACARNFIGFLPPDTTRTKQKPVVKPRVRFTMAADSLDEANKKKIDKLNRPTKINDSLKMDSLNLKLKKAFVPNPVKATWLAAIIPGGGQIYNRKYWKLPIVYGGLAGCAYALSWNNKMYKDYAQAYRDLLDDNPSTTSYKSLIPSGSTYTDSQLATILKNRKNMYRRYRDMSIFALIAVYAISIIDAYVDAELSNFDISPNLSMKVQPIIMDNKAPLIQDRKALGIQCSLKF